MPGLVNWPRRLKAGQIDAPMHIVDWMPTLLGVAGVTVDRDLKWDGLDVWAAITGKAKSIERTLYWKTPKAYAVRVGNWKLMTDNNFGKAMLFDLANDPLEKKDLAKEQAGRVAEIMEVLKKIAGKDRGRVK